MSVPYVNADLVLFLNKLPDTFNNSCIFCNLLCSDLCPFDEFHFGRTRV